MGKMHGWGGGPRREGEHRPRGQQPGTRGDREEGGQLREVQIRQGLEVTDNLNLILSDMGGHRTVCAGRCWHLTCILKRNSLATGGECSVEGQEWGKDTRLLQLHCCEGMGTWWCGVRGGQTQETWWTSCPAPWARWTVGTCNMPGC